MKKIISNDVVTLRSLEATDLEVLYRWENDSWLWTVSNIMAPSPKSYVWQYLQNYDSDFYNTRQLGYVRDYLGLFQLYALVPVDNTACASLLKKHGFTSAGLLKKWINHGTEVHDVEIMQLVF